jgi:hypothetical protein
MSKVRFQMFLEEEQKEFLEKLQRDSNTPVAEIIRKAVDGLMDGLKKNGNIPSADRMTRKLTSIAGICKAGPKDLADDHDKYLYGAAKD